MLHRDPVSSSMIAAIGYDEKGETLEVEFISGAVCRYFGVDADVYEDFRAASSKGGFFNRHIRDAYRWESVQRQGSERGQTWPNRRRMARRQRPGV